MGIWSCSTGRRTSNVTVHSEPALVARGRAAGALGYVLMDAAGDELVPAIRAALDGEPFVSSALAGRGTRGGKWRSRETR
jgi:DNA-binding NarL/FixJ family response regulator